MNITEGLSLDQITAACAIVAAVAACVAVLLAWFQGSATARLERRVAYETEALARRFTELDHGLRREIAASARDGLSAAFDKVQAGLSAQADGLDRFARTQREAIDHSLKHFGDQQAERLGGMDAALREDQASLRMLVTTQLEDMRRAVDEKLQTALEKQLRDSFANLQEQLSSVQQAIGQVQSVAGEVGDLRRLFSNVKSRGGWGEAQLEAMLADILPSGAFEKNFRVKEGSGEAVEFALRVPGRDGAHAWLSIDSKFPTEDYSRLVAAHEAGNREAEASARAALAARIRLEARQIDAKYIDTPRTLEFAVLYVPSDSLFAELARVPGLIEAVRRDSHVMVMGPSLLPAFLHTLRVSYVTLALEQKASAIGETLAAVKVEWARFGEALAAIKKQADTLSNGIGATLVRQRAVGRKLRHVDDIDDVRSDLLLGLGGPLEHDDVG